MTLLNYSVTQLASLLKKREISACELMQACLAQAEAAQVLNCFTHLDAPYCLRRAEESDARLARNEGGVLEAIPIAIKDVFCVKDTPTTAASATLRNFVAPYESSVTAALWKKGAVCFGKTNMDEFAMGSSSENSIFGPVLNPWGGQGSARLSPGGSSGGSAAVVAARIVPASLGTDTGGSVRQPGALCGVVGVKPTYGRCSRHGIIAFASSFDQAGVFTRNVADAALVLQAISGFDRRDSTSVDRPVPDYAASLETDVKGLRIGIPEKSDKVSVSPETMALWEKAAQDFAKAGADVKTVSIPLADFALPAYYIIAPAEAASNLARYDGVRYGLRVAAEDMKKTYARTRGRGFGEEVIRRILVGTYVLSAGYYDDYFMLAEKFRRRLRACYAEVFKEVDLLLTPTTPAAAFAPDDSEECVHMYSNDFFTVTANMTGIPAISVPVGLDGRARPLGLQLAARHFDEMTMFRGARALETFFAFEAAPEPWWRA